MYRSQPMASKICSKRWNDHNHDLHLQRLKEIKGTPSQTQKFQSSHEKLMDECNRLRNSDRKKLIMKQEAATEVERENRSLLEKMSRIMRTTYRSMSTSPKAIKQKSLNKEVRKQEIVKITIENQEMLKRIQSRQPNYSAKEWEKHSRLADNYFRNVCEYPPLLAHHGNFAHNKSTLSKSASTSYKQSFIGHGTQDFSQDNLQFGSARTQEHFRRSPGIKNDYKSDVFKKSMPLGDSVYTVEVSFSEMNFNILADNMENLDLKFIKVSHNEGRRLLKMYNGNFNAFLNDLYIEDNKLKHRSLETGSRSKEGSRNSSMSREMKTDRGFYKQSRMTSEPRLISSSQQFSRHAVEKLAGKYEKNNSNSDSRDGNKVEVIAETPKKQTPKSVSKKVRSRSDAKGSLEFDTQPEVFSGKIILNQLINQPHSTTQARSMNRNGSQGNVYKIKRSSVSSVNTDDLDLKDDADNARKRRHSAANIETVKAPAQNQADTSNTKHNSITESQIQQPSSRNDTPKEKTADNTPSRPLESTQNRSITHSRSDRVLVNPKRNSVVDSTFNSRLVLNTNHNKGPTPRKRFSVAITSENRTDMPSSEQSNARHAPLGDQQIGSPNVSPAIRETDEFLETETLVKKESQSEGPTDLILLKEIPPKDTPSNENPPMDIPSNDLPPPKDISSNEIPPKDISSNEIPPKDISSNDMPPDEAAPKD